jgi:ribA/ribD-fused uncharacterized protein
MEKRIYEPKEVISFRKTTEAFGALSNMASGFGLFVNDIIIPSSEHLYQAMRFPLFPDIQHEIISQENAMLAKKVSNKYKDKYTRPDWEVIKMKVMRWVMEVKLAQNWDNFSKVLRETEERAIVEYSKEDKIWGASPVNGKLEGVNALGRLLMELRQKYIHSVQKIYCVEPLNLSAFLLYNRPIEVVCDSDKFADFEIKEGDYELA